MTDWEDLSEDGYEELAGEIEISELRQYFAEANSMDDVVDALVNRVFKDFDAVVCIAGDEGVGKSSFSVQLGQGIAKKVNVPYSLDDNIIYNPNLEKVWNAILYKLPKYSPVQLDEAITLLYKMDYQSKMQKAVNKLYAVCRKENKITLLCIPSLFDLTAFFRNRRVILWIEIIARGVAVVNLRDWFPYISDKWHQKEAMKLYETLSKKKKIVDMTTQDKLAIFRKMPNYVFDFEFPDLPKDVKKQYKKRADAIKYDLNLTQEDSGLTKRYRDATNMAIVALAQEGYKQIEIANKLNISIGTINSVLKKERLRPSDK